MSRRNAARYRKARAREGKEARPFRRHSDVPEGQRYCPACRIVQPVANFGRNRSVKSGLTSYCKPCHNRIMKEQAIKKHGSIRDFHLKRRYGLTSREVDERAAAQGGTCAICRRKEPKHVDHNSATGVVRGILCFGCNGGIGQLDHDPWRIRQAARYLEGELWYVAHMAAELDAEGVPRLLPKNSPRSGQRKSEREYRLRRRFRVSEPYVDALAKLQKGLCAICCDEKIEAVDHDHATGEFRGLLCLGCNTGMGQLGDDPAVLRAAADYLDVDYAGQWELLESLLRPRAAR
ncbi:endonuclease VII domain-containing protein [Actinocorallia sp. API 0066]|uniref:endonuclease domain-containing protein n=1 Tax=Actinocorallia sp. API 0066 TaxID=2896846 RepID=UPI001E47073E|nr:endonuclease domain-containing protein [Actinocorallia sp. API 0066]MCD0450102.1 endonuclease VII domain-containing protein [Actinocorallia sp. API 0066]